MARFLQGPFGLTRMEFAGNVNSKPKVFHLFHDVHTQDSKCPADTPGVVQIDEFMENLVKDAAVPIDFILETPDSSSPLDISTPDASYLSMLRNRFARHFSSKHQQTCSNVRFHFNDQVRQMLLAQTVVSEYECAVTLKHAVFGNTPKAFNTNMRATFKIDRQLNACPRRIRVLIDEWLNEQVAATRMFVGKFISGVDNTFGPNGMALIPYMEAYTVARCFRKFRTGDEMRNVFLYMGAYHTDRIINLLKRLGCVVTANVVNADMHQCVDMRSFLPLRLVGGNETNGGAQGE